MSGGAHDTLRDETPRETAMFDAHEALAHHAAGEFSYPAVLAQFAGILDRYADAQVAAERERDLAAIESAIADAADYIRPGLLEAYAILAPDPPEDGGQP